MQYSYHVYKLRYTLVFSHFRYRQPSSFRTSAVMMPDLENIGIAVKFRCYHVYKLRYTLLYIHFRLQAAIF